MNVCETFSNECTMMTFTVHGISVASDRNGLLLDLERFTWSSLGITLVIIHTKMYTFK